MDNAAVYFLSTFAPATSAVKGVCRRRVGNKIVEVERPPVVELYNTTMLGVDLSDQYRATHPIHIPRLKRWWLQLFFWLLDTTIENSRILYVENTNDLTLKSSYNYRLQLAADLTKGFTLMPAFQGTSSHLVRAISEKIGVRRRRRNCRVCGNKTTWICSTCDVPLCLHECLATFHERITKTKTKTDTK